MKQFRGIRAVLLFWYSTVFAVSAIVLVVFIYFLTAHQLMREVDKFLMDEVNEHVHFMLGAEEDPEKARSIIEADLAHKTYFQIFCRVFEARRGCLLFSTPSMFAEIPFDKKDIAAAATGTKIYGTVRGVPEHRTYRVLFAPVGSNLPARYVVQSGMRLRRLEQRLARFRNYLALVIPAILVASLAGGWFLSGRSIRPINEIIQRLGEIRSRNLSLRLPPRAVPDEIKHLTDAINAMLSEIEEAFNRIRAFTADAAHELRTPVAALRCLAEVSLSQPRTIVEYEETLQQVVERCEALSRVLDDLLFLAQTDAVHALPETSPVNLGKLLAELWEPFDILAHQKRISLNRQTATQELVVQGHPGWLRVLLANLLDNAVKYTPPGGVVELSTFTEGKKAVLSLRNTGPLIPPSVLPHIFDRFYRGDPSRSRETGGAGLGLSICKRIVELHGGEISAKSEPDSGTTFQVTLPIATSSGTE